jgi:hypothetical protein
MRCTYWGTTTAECDDAHKTSKLTKDGCIPLRHHQSASFSYLVPIPLDCVGNVLPYAAVANARIEHEALVPPPERPLAGVHVVVCCEQVVPAGHGIVDHGEGHLLQSQVAGLPANYPEMLVPKTKNT